MGTRSPSKHLSLKYLMALRESHYCNKERRFDYVPEEVDALIYQKSTKLEQIKLKRELSEQEEYALYKLKKAGVKYCSKCHRLKKLREFSPDKSKKYFNRRSHCRDCRHLYYLDKKIPF